MNIFAYAFEKNKQINNNNKIIKQIKNYLGFGVGWQSTTIF